MFANDRVYKPGFDFQMIVLKRVWFAEHFSYEKICDH
jgi:hypothetical protein